MHRRVSVVGVLGSLAVLFGLGGLAVLLYERVNASALGPFESLRLNNLGISLGICTGAFVLSVLWRNALRRQTSSRANTVTPMPLGALWFATFVLAHRRFLPALWVLVGGLALVQMTLALIDMAQPSGAAFSSDSVYTAWSLLSLIAIACNGLMILAIYTVSPIVASALASARRAPATQAGQSAPGVGTE